MIYLDSNVFLYPITNPDSEKGNAAKRLLMRLANGQIEAITSSLTWDELVWVAKEKL